MSDWKYQLNQGNDAKRNVIDDDYRVESVGALRIPGVIKSGGGLLPAGAPT